MIEAHETFDGTWPFAPNFFHGNGFAMHYVDENPEGTETFLCVHGGVEIPPPEPTRRGTA